MKNEYLEKVFETEQTWSAATEAERKLGGAFIRSKRNGFDVVTYDQPLHEIADILPEFIKVMQAAQLTEIYYTGAWSNWQDDALKMDEAGLKLRGIVRMENPVRKQELERWGHSLEAETIPALRFSLE